MTPEVITARKALRCLYLEVHEAIADDVWNKVDKAFESLEDATVTKCVNELLKQTHLMRHTNDYPSEAVPKSTILMLPNIIKISRNKNEKESNDEWNSED